MIEKRNHIGGNCYDYIDEDTGILLIEIDILIYRDHKPLARHIKFLIISNGIKHNIIDLSKIDYKKRQDYVIKEILK